MSDNKLAESVIMPREDFLELSAVAFDNHHIPSTNERVAQSVQTFVLFGTMAAAVTAGSWGWAKAVEWREKKAHERGMEKAQFEIDNGIALK